MSARERAGFGYLYLRQGQWRDRQVVPARRVTRSVMAYSVAPAVPRSAMASSGRRRTGATPPWAMACTYIAVIPSNGLVVVHRVLYELPREDVVSYRDIDAMIRLIIAAASLDTRPLFVYK